MSHFWRVKRQAVGVHAERARSDSRELANTAVSYEIEYVSPEFRQSRIPDRSNGRRQVCELSPEREGYGNLMSVSAKDARGRV